MSDTPFAKNKYGKITGAVTWASYQAVMKERDVLRAELELHRKQIIHFAEGIKNRDELLREALAFCAGGMPMTTETAEEIAQRIREVLGKGG